MAYRSPSKNQELSEKYYVFIKSNEMSENEFFKYLENEKKQFEMWIETFEDDYEQLNSQKDI